MIRRLLTAAAVLLLLVVTTGCDGSTASKRRMVVVAVDGLDPEALEALVRRGRVPNLARMRREGTWGLLDAGELTSADAVWTSVATGMPPDRHGVFETVLRDHPLPTPEAPPVDPDSITALPLWELAGAQDVSTAVVGWSPLPPPENTTWALSLSDEPVAGATPMVDPVDVASLDIADLRPFLDVDDLGSARRDPRVERLLGALARAETVRRETTRLFVEERPGMLVCRVDLITDIARDFGRQAAPQLGDVEPAAYARERLAVEAAHVWCDQWIGELLELSDADTTVFLVSGRGLRSGDMRRRVPDPSEHFHRWVRRHGLWIAWGGGIDTGAVVTRSPLVDVVPTVLAARGLEVPAALEGEVRTAVFSGRVVPVEAERNVERQASASTEPPSLSGRLLRAALLIDVGETERALEELDGDPTDASGPERGYFHALRSRALVLAGRLEEASDAQDVAQRAWPRGHPVEVSAGLLLTAEGRLTQAIERFRNAIEADPSLPDPYLLLASSAERMMLAAGAQHDLRAREQSRNDALRVLEQLLPYDPLHERALAYTARLRLAGADPSTAEQDALAALQLLQSALQLDPFSTELMNHLAIAYLRVGSTAARDPARVGEATAAFTEARTWLERLLEIDPSDARGWANLGYVRWRLEDLLGARDAAREALRIDPDYPLHPAFEAALRAAGHAVRETE